MAQRPWIWVPWHGRVLTTRSRASVDASPAKQLAVLEYVSASTPLTASQRQYPSCSPKMKSCNLPSTGEAEDTATDTTNSLCQAAKISSLQKVAHAKLYVTMCNTTDLRCCVEALPARGILVDASASRQHLKPGSHRTACCGLPFPTWLMLKGDEHGWIECRTNLRHRLASMH